MVSSAEVAPLPDDTALWIVCVGRKGAGKTVLAHQLWDSWDGDRVLIDITGDVGRDYPDPHTHDIDQIPPHTWPEWLQQDDEDRLSLRYVPDHGDPDWRTYVDDVVGLCYSHGDCLLWIDDAGQALAVGKAGPNEQRLMMMSRHQNVSVLLTMPRTQTIEVLALSQADIIYSFDLPSPNDRRRLADNIGWDPRQVDEAIAGLPKHGYLRAHIPEHELSIWPPLPTRVTSRRRRHIDRYMTDGDETE